MPNGGLQSTILRAVLGKKDSKDCGFLVQTGQRNQSIQSSFGLSFVLSK